MCSSLALPVKQVGSKGHYHQRPEPTNEHINLATNLHETSISPVPTNKRRVRLYNKNGFFLKISNTGKLRGTRSFSNPNSKYIRVSNGLVWTGWIKLICRCDRLFRCYTMFWFWSISMQISRDTVTSMLCTEPCFLTRSERVAVHTVDMQANKPHALPGYD